ncbi:alpha/beta fold hydrolase [Bacillus massilinigeriensis]|uniref:alpha/beta fold hydrolase n=1 Tax=Bacillus mediterraneensis TaxID=1805474 RepID=UPI000B13A0BD|nr:alpha/beta hydrolase [Bacillus mediterraneensis]
MSDNSMREIDKKIIGDVFKYIRLEQEMPKLTTKRELSHYSSPTLIIAGKKDIFFPASRLNKVAREIIPNLITFKTYNMGHFPSEEHLIKINSDVVEFLKDYY